MRTFEAKPAVRESVPLWMGLMGPSGGGKTMSALRIATGIQSVTGGEIFGIDTESRRMLHYADKFKFRHLQFDAPFASLDYLEAIRYCHEQGGRIIIVDSASHEHEGPGGLLDFHDSELQRMAGDDFAKRERVNMLAWREPKAARQRMINSCLQMPISLIWCFRAKEKVKKAGKEWIPQGFMPISGEELVFEMTVNCLLLPHANGVPTWNSQEIGERMMMKLPVQFRDLFRDGEPLSEDIGAALARWARGEGPKTATAPEQEWNVDQFLTDATKIADEKGTQSLATFWGDMPRKIQKELAKYKDDLKEIARQTDAKKAGATVEGVI